MRLRKEEEWKVGREERNEIAKEWREEVIKARSGGENKEGVM